jgi:hypothetical protein
MWLQINHTVDVLAILFKQAILATPHIIDKGEPIFEDKYLRYFEAKTEKVSVFV